ncbi:MAG TPA: helix-turn-helix domain-containing protein [Gemmatimonadaceae bacterium]|nr:helix-turn-helix domain-containing protein [Gemmatimonadaceae bacterium]
MRVVAYCYLDQEAAQALVMAARAGLDDIIIRPKDQAAALRHAVLTRSTSGHVAQVVGAALDARLPPYSRRVIQYCLDHAGESLAVVKAAAALGVHRKTLVDRLAREGSPPPSTLIGWSRLLLAVHVLETSTCSIEALALQLGFSSGAALHNMLKRYTGRRAAELRSAGALKAVIDQLCRAYRSTTTPDPEFARASEQATRVSELSEPIAHREPGSVMPAALRWAPDPENGEHQDAQAALPRDRESDVA